MSGHAAAVPPSSVTNSRRFIANSVRDALNPSVSNFSAQVQAVGCPTWGIRVDISMSDLSFAIHNTGHHRHYRTSADGYSVDGHGSFDAA
jgi:hypothetical protein